MELNVQAVIGLCGEFRDENLQQGEVSIVISPLKVNLNEDGGKVSIITGCNLWKSCHNEACWYSVAARDKKKVQAGK